MNCDICNKEVETKDEELIGAKMLVFKEGDDEYKVLRCDPCFEKDQSLRNYKKIETYSRVCGYICSTAMA